MAKRYRYKTKLYTLGQLAALARVSRATLFARMKYYGYSVADAVEIPPLKRGRPSRSVTYAGRSLTIREWSEVTGVPDKTLATRLYHGWSIEQTLATPTPAQRRAGVVSNFETLRGTGAGSTAQEIPEITFSEQAENA
ncbi:hypothetical protein EN978_07225 [Mesorhizobium sp. M7A.F.Ca.US.001.04.1.1]|uniref:hypothetical protein n=1 Tax=unclassified Mesorhizobium TaxID=325217 RepID=UPI000FCC21D1|nr:MULTISPECIES: hypothetical protein [unclassified Mesorhizobium]RUY31695.1 hypothetical protein EN979_02055 [Mesorhizobium sp. M7A.F.Ca.US.001.04.2.1]RUY44117.1 hypothetical protein EN978_07225 [Mesorhizobium sp. M7A.F.Ca.US.001.04.1.1]